MREDKDLVIPELPVLVPESATRKRSRLDEMLDDLPAPMRRLARDRRGYPVPWFVDRQAPQIDGCPDFRIMDGDHLKTAIRERRCWVCGGRLTTPLGTFVAGPMCGVNRNSAEPPCHLECAQWSARACPFLSQPKRIRDDRNLPSSHMAGHGILRNPGVTMLWTCEGYDKWRPEKGGILFNLRDPVAVEWVREGRPATRGEVLESVETGLSLLLRQAAQEGAEACFELGRMTERFLPLLPAESGAADAPEGCAQGNSGRTS